MAMPTVKAVSLMEVTAGPIVEVGSTVATMDIKAKKSSRIGKGHSSRMACTTYQRQGDGEPLGTSRMVGAISKDLREWLRGVLQVGLDEITQARSPACKPLRLRSA
jgi:hypothetical protein